MKANMKIRIIQVRILLIGGIIVLLNGLMPGKLQAQNGSYRIDQQNSGFSNSINENFTHLKWKYKTGGMVFSSPLVSGGYVFFGSHDSCIYALHAETAEVRWKFKTNDIVTSSPAVQDSVVYALSMDANLYALDMTTGNERWHFTTGGENKRIEYGLYGTKPLDEYVADAWDFYLSSPLIVDSLLFFGSSDSNVYAINIRTGQMLWKTKTGQAVHSTPAYFEEKVFCASWDGKIYALDAITGFISWSKDIVSDTHPLYQGVQASPAVSEGVVFIGSRDRRIFALHATDGSEKWVQTVGNTWVPGSIAFDDERIYSGSSIGTKSIYCFDKNTGERVYLVNINNVPFASPVITDQWLYEGAFNGRLYGIEKQGGTIRWEFQPSLSVQNHLNLSRVDGTMDESSVLHFHYDSTVAQGQWLGEFFKTGSVISSPASANGTIYFTTTDSCIYALETVSLQLDDVDLESLVKDTVVSFDLDVMVDSGIYDSVTVSVKSNSETTRNAFKFKPSTFAFLPGNVQNIQVELATRDLAISTRRIPLYIDFWQSGNRNRAIVYIGMELSDNPLTGYFTDTEDQGPLLSCYPNPFSESISVTYSVLVAESISLSLVNSAGTEVLRIEEGFRDPGLYSTTKTLSIPDGLYTLRFINGSRVLSKKVIAL